MAWSLRTLKRATIGATLLAVAGLAPLPSAPLAQGPAAAVVVPPPLPVASDKCGPLIRKKGGGTWRCTFVDDFKGRTLGPAWGTHDSEKTGWRWGVTCFRPGPQNVKVARGRLILTVRREERPFRCGPLLRSFTTKYTGGLVGLHKGQTYGRFEVRAKWPTDRVGGLHGGFWMNPVERVYGRWPNSGEIDISEWWSDIPRTVLSALHYKGRERKVDSSWLDCTIKNLSGFHVYTAVWKPQIIRFYIDGELCFARRWEPDAPLERPQPFDQDFRMIMGMGVNKPTGKRAITDATQLPGRYIIDYAKSWK